MEGDAMIGSVHDPPPRVAPGGRPLARARRLAERCDCDLEHADHVADLALSLFDQLHEAHQLGRDDRALLHVAAVVHDIGRVDGSKGHHKRSADRIMAADELPDDPRWRRIVAATARYHRKALPKTRHKHFGNLSPADRDRVRWLAGCLRLADGLGKGSEPLVTRVECTLSPHTLLLDCFAEDPAEATSRLGGLRKRDLLSQALARPIEYVVHEAADQASASRP